MYFINPDNFFHPNFNNFFNVTEINNYILNLFKINSFFLKIKITPLLFTASSNTKVLNNSRVLFDKLLNFRVKSIFYYKNNSVQKDFVKVLLTAMFNYKIFFSHKNRFVFLKDKLLQNNKIFMFLKLFKHKYFGTGKDFNFELKLFYKTEKKLNSYNFNISNSLSEFY